MTEQQFLYIFEILDSMQKSLNSYIKKFPEKKTDKFTIERINNLQALIDFYNNAVDFKKQNTIKIENQQNYIDLLEITIRKIVKIMINESRENALSDIYLLLTNKEHVLKEENQFIYDKIINQIFLSIHLTNVTNEKI